MSGLFGIVDLTANTDPQIYLNNATAKMSHFQWFESNTWIAPNSTVGLGKLSIGIFNREPQPYVSADGQLTLFMVGEFYHTEKIESALDAVGIVRRNNSDPELALCAFQRWGADCASHLEGAFLIAVYDHREQQFILANDRFGLYPTYYAYQSGKLAFAPEIKGVLCAPFVQRKLDMTAVAQYFRFQHLLEEKTFHEDVKILSYGSVGRFDLQTGQWIVRRYWDWDQIPDRSSVTYEEAVIESSRLMRNAVERLSADSLRPAVFLSGGLDSRSILGLMKPRNPSTVTATFGVRNCRDVYFAEQIARAKGSNHHWFELKDGNWILENVDLHLKLTEGFHNWVHMHGITMLPKLRQEVDYNLTGWDGGVLMNHPYIKSYQLLHNSPDHATSTVHLFDGFISDFTWPGITESEELMLYTPTIRKQMNGLAFQSLQDEYKRYEKFKLLYRGEYFYIANHCFRMTLNMNTIARSHFEVRFPFFDYDSIDFMFSLNLDVRKRSIYRDLITREMPDLAVIPYDKQEYLPTVEPVRHTLQAVSVRARRRLGLYPNRPTLYADYESYLRNELRSWAESILYDSRTEQRGITNPAFVRSLMERHIAGREEWTIGKIAPLITFEMMMRAYID